MTKTILFGITFLLLVGCGSSRPDEVILESDSMTVTHVETLHPHTNAKYQHKTEYWISDSRRGFVLWSNQKFEIGDKIKIVKDIPK